MADGMLWCWGKAYSASTHHPIEDGSLISTVGDEAFGLDFAESFWISYAPA
jgi:hypothetical protein